MPSFNMMTTKKRGFADASENRSPPNGLTSQAGHRKKAEHQRPSSTDQRNVGEAKLSARSVGERSSKFWQSEQEKLLKENNLLKAALFQREIGNVDDQKRIRNIVI
jgi:hypothetical protein